MLTFHNQMTPIQCEVVRIPFNLNFIVLQISIQMQISIVSEICSWVGFWIQTIDKWNQSRKMKNSWLQNTNRKQKTCVIMIKKLFLFAGILEKFKIYKRVFTSTSNSIQSVD